MCGKYKLAQRLRGAEEIAREKLLEQYSAFVADFMLKKIKALVDSIDYSTYKKSIALYISADIGKVSYLDIEVEEKVIVKQSFEIKDVISNKQRVKEYLLLTIGNNKANLFLCADDHLKVLVTNTSDHTGDVSSFINPQDNEMRKKKFIHHIDDVLNIILNAYPLPLFVAGIKDSMNYFIQLSKNSDHIVEYITGDYEKANKEQLKDLLSPYLKNWKNIKEKYLLLQLAKASNAGKCAKGIIDVYKVASQRKGKLLIIERDYLSVASKGESVQLGTVENSTFENSNSLKNTVDDVIEIILENGGDVEFVSNGLLENFMHIALIQKVLTV